MVTPAEFVDRLASSLDMACATAEEERAETTFGVDLRSGEDLYPISGPHALATAENFKRVGFDRQVQLLHEAAVVGAIARHQPVGKHGEQRRAFVGAMEVHQAWKAWEVGISLGSLQVHEPEHGVA